MRLYGLNLKVKKRNGYLGLLVFLFIMESGSAFGNLFAMYITPLFLVTAFVCYMLYPRKHIKKSDKLFCMLFLVGFHFLSILFYAYDGINLSAYISYILRIFACFLFCGCLDTDEFENMFIRVMFVIASMSLVCFHISQTKGIVSSAVVIDKYTLLGVYNYTGYEIKRNSGIFWEPGAYQLFLNLAILFYVKSKNLSIKSLFSITGIVFVVSVLTTRSTTGYFTLAVIIAYLVFANWHALSWKQRVICLIPMLLLFVSGISVLLSLDTIVNKFNGTGNSFAIRLNDFFKSGGAIIQHPFIGYGLGTHSFVSMASSRGIVANSVGLFCSAIYFGVIYAAYYTFRIFKNSRQTQQKHFVVFAIIIFFSMMTEDFYRSAIYFVLAIGVQQYDKDFKKNN